MKVNVADKNLMGVLHANDVGVGLKGADEVKRALDNPINSKRLQDIVKSGEKIAIITSDITRPMPSRVVIPPVLDELYEAGVRDGDITIVFALGSHRKHTEEEKKRIVGEAIYKKIRCIDSDSTDFIHLGCTKYNTPVDIFRTVAQADRRICLGNIEYHYFAGYSGGAKAIMPGVSTRSAIQANHRMMVDEASCAGKLETNPVRCDIDEAAKFVPIDFIVNVVLNEEKEIIKAVAGHYIDAHREGCRFLDSLYKIKIKSRADIVITSPGGFPKDLNLYQAQKALDNAKHAVKKGGIIILVASCREGLGEKTFEEWITNMKEPEELIYRIKTDFKLGGHKAAAIAMVLKNANVYLVSDMDKNLVQHMHFKPFGDAQSALNHALHEIGEDASVLIIPHGGSILPVLE